MEFPDIEGQQARSPRCACSREVHFGDPQQFFNALAVRRYHHERARAKRRTNRFRTRQHQRGRRNRRRQHLVPTPISFPSWQPHSSLRPHIPRGEPKRASKRLVRKIRSSRSADFVLVSRNFLSRPREHVSQLLHLLSCQDVLLIIFLKLLPQPAISKS
jgi:hypothetical protein